MANNQLDAQTVKCIIYLDKFKKIDNNTYYCSLQNDTNNIIDIYYPNDGINITNTNDQEIKEQIENDHIISFVKNDEYLKRYILILMADSESEYSNCEIFNENLKIYNNNNNTSIQNINGWINKECENNLNYYIDQIDYDSNKITIYLDYNSFMYYAKENEISTRDEENNRNIYNINVIKEILKKLLNYNSNIQNNTHKKFNFENSEIKNKLFDT